MSHDQLATGRPSPKTVFGRAPSPSGSSTSRAITLALGIVVVLGHGTARGEVPRPKEVAAEGAGVKKLSPWRASEMAYRNSVTAITFDRSSELTYNPFWGMALELSPRFWFDEVWSVAASIEIFRELTEADDTTRADETQLSDLNVRFLARNLARIPGIDADLTAIFGLSFPTSLASQGQTMLFTLAPAVRLGWFSDAIFEGFAFGYTARFTKLFYRFTTGELESPSVPGCFVGSSGSCDRFLNTGVRNASYRFSNNLDASLFFTDWLSMSASFGVVVSWLFDDVEDERVSYQELEGQDERYALVADLGFTMVPTTSLAITVGASTFNPQLAPDGSRYTPFFNRFSTLYLDVRLDVGALVEKLSN